MKKLPFLVVLLTAFTASCFAADAVATAAASAGPLAAGLDWLNLVIAGLTPIVIAGIKKFVPKLPLWLLPFAAPLVGLALDQLSKFAFDHPGNWLAGPIAGATGLWLREVVDQTTKRGGNGDAAPPTAGTK